MRPEDRQRLSEVVEVLQALARLEFTAQATVGDKGDLFDALAAGVNMLGEELASFRQEVDDRAEALALANEELARRVLYDSLTGIANRALFIDRLEHALLRTARTDPKVAVLFIDLDDFKRINDAFGHSSGDGLLKAIASRLEHAIRAGDTAARLGGDEFGVILEDVDGAGAVHIADRVIDAIARPLPIDGKELTVTGSIGIAFPGPSHDTASDLLRAADIAMYNAKGEGKGRFSVYQPEMHRSVLLGLELRQELEVATRQLEAATGQTEIFLVYQPIVELRTGRVAGMEALARWQNPRRGLIPPSEFIPIAEQGGLILQLGRSVLSLACAQLRDWRATLGACAPDYIAVNVSARQLKDDGLVPDIRAALEAADLEPERLMLEVTESNVIDDAAVAKLVELKALGVRLAIDDFGTGYSSLSLFARSPFHVVKLDRSFISGQGSDSQTLVRLIVNLAQEMQRDVVAEGVETADQARRLRRIGCRLAQGYYFAAPMDAGQMTPLLRNWSAAGDG